MKYFISALSLLLALLILAACGTTPPPAADEDTTPAQKPAITTPASSADTQPGEETTPYPLLITGPLPDFLLTQHNLIDDDVYSNYPRFNKIAAPPSPSPDLTKK